MRLSYGIKMLSATFGTFTICYVSRAIYDCTVQPTLDFPNLFSGIAMPLIWDFVPIVMMYIYHFQNMRMMATTVKNDRKVKSKYDSNSYTNISVITSSEHQERQTEKSREFRDYDNSDDTSTYNDEYVPRGVIGARSSLVRQAEAVMLAQTRNIDKNASQFPEEMVTTLLVKQREQSGLMSNERTRSSKFWPKLGRDRDIDTLDTKSDLKTIENDIDQFRGKNSGGTYRLSSHVSD